MAKYSDDIRVAALVKQGFSERSARAIVESQHRKDTLKKLGVYTDRGWKIALLGQ